MTRRIWTKPFIKYNLSGDRTVAKSLERRARACVGYLFDQLMPNQKFRSQNWNYPDGSRITAFVWRDVLGDRARVEVFSPSGKETLVQGFLYVDSGYINILDLSTIDKADRNIFPPLHQSPRTFALHKLGGVQVSKVETEPPSFSYDTESPQHKTYASILTSKINSILLKDQEKATGKFRLYQQARRGRKLTTTSLPVIAVQNSLNTTNGIFTDEKRGFWLVAISAFSAEPTVRFTRLLIPDDARSVLASATTKDEILVAETYALAYAEESDDPQDTYECAIPLIPGYAEYMAHDPANGNFTAPQTIANGFHFNWDGDKASAVIIETVHGINSNTINFFTRSADFRSHVVELSFSKDEIDNEIVFSVDVSVLETSEWFYSHKINYWIWKSTGTQISAWQVTGHQDILTPEFSFPNNTPVYCFYTGDDHRNNTLSIARITIQEQDAPESLGPCSGDNKYYGFAQAGWQVGEIYSYGDTDRVESVAFGAYNNQQAEPATRAHSYVVSPATGFWSAEEYVAVGWTPTYTETYDYCENPDSSELFSLPNISPVEYSNTRGVRRRYVLNGEQESVVTSEFTTASCRLIIPKDNSEALFVSRSNIYRKKDARSTLTFNNVSAGYILDRIEARDRSLGNAWVTVYEGFHLNGKRLNWWASSATTTTYEWSGSADDEIISIGKCGVIGGVSFATADEATENNLNLTTPASYLTGYRGVDDPDWRLAWRVTQGVSREARVSLLCNEITVDNIRAPAKEAWAENRSVYNGFPAALKDDDLSRAIGFG